MIKGKSLAELEVKLEAGRKKALKVNPRIEVIEAGLYHVEGSKGNWYEVRCGRTESGEFFIACLCKGALHVGGCYHAAIAFYKHKHLKELELRFKKAEVSSDEILQSPYLKQSSDKNPEKLGNVRIN